MTHQNDWILIDKPLGPTSTQVTSQVRRIFGVKKAGHGGTLDPLATGLLPIALGEATKTVPWVMDAPKEYEFTVRWGESTTTDDGEGAVTHTSDHWPTAAQISAVLPQFQGEISQIPPAFSAIKVDGKRSYDLARAGVAVPLKARTVTIFELTLMGQSDPQHAHFKVHCSKGTYVRSLARDMAIALGTFGYVTTLRRTRIGNFKATDAILLDYLKNLGHSPILNRGFCAIYDALDDIPGIFVSVQEADDLRKGRAIPLQSPLNLGPDQMGICLLNGVAVALVRLDEQLLRPFRVFNL
jgi:tRNA pseudouridine55 synthase